MTPIYFKICNFHGNSIDAPVILTGVPTTMSVVLSVKSPLSPNFETVPCMSEVNGVRNEILKKVAIPAALASLSFVISGNDIFFAEGAGALGLMIWMSGNGSLK